MKKKGKFTKFIDRSRFTLNHCQLKNSGRWDNLFVTQFVTGGLHTSRRAFTLFVSLSVPFPLLLSSFRWSLTFLTIAHTYARNSTRRRMELVFQETRANCIKIQRVGFLPLQGGEESRELWKRKRWVMEGRDFKTLLRVVTGQRSDFLAFHIFALELAVAFLLYFEI